MKIQEVIMQLYVLVLLFLALSIISPSLAVTERNSHFTIEKIEKVDFYKLSTDEQQLVTGYVPPKDFLHLLTVSKELYTNLYEARFQYIWTYNPSYQRSSWGSLLNYLQEAKHHNRQVSLKLTEIPIVFYIEGFEESLKDYWDIIKYLDLCKIDIYGDF